MHSRSQTRAALVACSTDAGASLKYEKSLRQGMLQIVREQFATSRRLHTTQHPKELQTSLSPEIETLQSCRFCPVRVCTRPITDWDTIALPLRYFLRFRRRPY